MNKWTEAQLVAMIIPIASMCTSGILSWETKEKILDDLLEVAGWTRAELQDLNRRRQAVNN